ncbi:MAG TPA: DUF4082 domain-containing protein [Mycobacteriales bacterium]|jgi:hypothetical protein|nr:DUF4082 domain-containing protein [Mycobacteriales bacterium]
MKRVVALTTAAVVVGATAGVTAAVALPGAEQPRIQSLYTGASPSGQVDGDRQAVTVGVVFSTAKNGTVRGVQFFRGSAQSRPSAVTLWSTGGKRLATTRAAAGQGWVSTTFATPVPVTAGTRYVASYFTDRGSYNSDDASLAAARTVGDLAVPARAGVYRYGAAEAFPRQRYAASEYFVSPLFAASGDTAPAPTTTPAPAPSATTTAPGAPSMSPVSPTAKPTTPAPTTPSGSATGAPPAGALPHDPAYVGPDYYAKWKTSFPTDPGFFPVSVFDQTPQRPDKGATAADYQAWGANTFVGLYNYGDSPWTAQALAAAKAQGMYTVGAATPDADSFPGGSANRGNMIQPDEPEGNVAASTYDADAQQAKQQDPERPTYGNFTKGMVYAGKTADLQLYCRNIDITSTDIYGYTDPWEAGGPHSGAWVYGLGIDRQQQMCPGKAAWGFVETTRPFSGNNDRITPDEAEQAVFNVLVHGGRGVEYFIHDFDGGGGEYAVLTDAAAVPVKTRLASVNSWIKTNAPALNAPTVAGVTVTSSTAVPGTVLAKDVGGKLWMLAQADGNESHTMSGATDLTVKVPVPDGTVIDVVGEGRSLTVKGGTITDHFGAYQHRVYQAR